MPCERKDAKRGWSTEPLFQMSSYLCQHLARSVYTVYTAALEG